MFKIRAYKTDASMFHKVDMENVYEVATGDDNDMLPMVKGQIQPWIGKNIFAIAPPGSKQPLLYTPASASMKRWGDPAVLTNDEKMNRVLVPLIPLDARIKMIMLEQIVVAGTTTVDDDLHRTLRTEIMTITHAMQLPHASRMDTMKALRNMAYWPLAETDVQRFCDT